MRSLIEARRELKLQVRLLGYRVYWEIYSWLWEPGPPYASCRWCEREMGVGHADHCLVGWVCRLGWRLGYQPSRGGWGPWLARQRRRAAP